MIHFDARIVHGYMPYAELLLVLVLLLLQSPRPTADIFQVLTYRTSYIQ